MLNPFSRAALAALFTCALTAGGFAEVLRVDISSSRSPSETETRVTSAVKHYNLRLARLSYAHRLFLKDRAVFSMPVRVDLVANGRSVRPDITRDAGDEITLQFDTSGSRAFPVEYRTFLQNTFNASKAAMEAVFGPPNTSATVKVLNYDADIFDRQSLTGGYYVHNAPGGPEIRFPVYQSGAAAGVNFIHTLLLAYMGDAELPYDAWEEGLVRAATMVVARTPGSIPGISIDLIEVTMDSLYDASSYYDWSNVPGLGSPTFIAPNLLADPLPTGGSTGGIFLLRHQMAGTAWAKVLAEHPGFVKEFNRRFQLNPSAYQTESTLTALGQTSLDTVAGQSGATVEGLSFSDWSLRQFIFDSSVVGGLHLVPQAVPFPPTAGTSDFGVFGIVLNAFRTDSLGHETLLSGTSYPLYWRPDFSRFFTSAQDDVIPVSGAYGSVVPNFPGDTFANAPYRVAVDLPFLGKITRVYLPAGAISTGSQIDPNNAYGTVTGFPAESGVNYFLNIQWIGGNVQNVPVRNFAFGTLIGDSSFEPAQPVTLTLRRVQGSSSTNVLVRQVNKGRGPLMVDLRSDESHTSFTIGRPNRLNSIGIPVEPYRSRVAQILGYADDQTLVARFNPFFGRYDLFPTEGSFNQGLGYFARTTGQAAVTVEGQTSANTPIAVALQAGWNLISVPMQETVPTTNVQVTTSSLSVGSWNDALGDLLGATFFRFQPDPVNADFGTLVAATQFEPGQAYFVRSLRPEGAVLLFNPSTRERAVNAVTVAPPRANPVWSGVLSLKSYRGQVAQVELVQVAGAKRHWDWSEDSQLAPGPGGFQIAVVNRAYLYKDVRPPLKNEPYVVQLSGLVPGERYAFAWTDQSGLAQFNVQGVARGQLTSRSSVQFFANAPTMTFTLVSK